MLSLDELASHWLRPAREEDFSLPTITNFLGVVQASWSVSGIQKWVCAPTGMSTPTALLFSSDAGRIRRFPRACEYRWKAYEIERRAPGVSTTLRMPPGTPAIIERMRFDRPMRIHLVFSGLPRVWRFTDYWNIPPEDVPMFNASIERGKIVLQDTKTFGRAEFTVPGSLELYDDLQSFLDNEPPLATGSRGRVAVATIDARPNEDITWYALQGTVPTADLDVEREWHAAREHWDRTWRATFTSANTEFSGHLPPRTGDLERLYDMSVLTLLMTRRILPPLDERASVATGGQCIWNEEPRPLERCYVVGGPEGAPTTSFLWELMFQAPLLARLDPDVLRAQMEAFMRVDLHHHWGVDMVSGRGAGMGYGVNAGAFLSCVSDYVRITGDRAWALSHIDYLRSCARPDLTDYSHYQHILECVSSYEHTIASFNALNAKGLRFLADLTGEPQYAHQADRLAQQVLSLYEGGPFACLQPDGSRRVVHTILDFAYVATSIPGDIPPDMRDGMVRYFQSELQTPDWLYALSPRDPNALTPSLPSFQTFRADHQATGAYDGWPAKAASALARLGAKDAALPWLRRLEQLTYEGPFAQAHYIHKDATRKASFFNGNMNFAAAGCGYAAALLDDFST
jgi:hypothetical protein